MGTILGRVLVDATVRRTKENYGIICVAKLKELPPNFSDWMDRRNDKLDGQTPQAVIEAGEGHLAEVLLERLVHMHEAFIALAAIHERYADVPELEVMWEAFENAWNDYTVIISNHGG